MKQQHQSLYFRYFLNYHIEEIKIYENCISLENIINSDCVVTSHDLQKEQMYVFIIQEQHTLLTLDLLYTI